MAAARREQRIILTRDRRLLERKAVTHGCFVRFQDPEQQLLFVLRRFDLAAAVRPFSRCMRCNEPLEPVAKADILHRLPPRVRVEQQSFSRCPRCARLYWPGSHWQRMRRRLDTLLAATATARADSRPPEPRSISIRGCYARGACATFRGYNKEPRWIQSMCSAYGT